MKKNRMGLYLIYSSVTALVIFIASMISMTVYDIKKIPDLIDDIVERIEGYEGDIFTYDHLESEQFVSNLQFRQSGSEEDYYHLSTFDFDLAQPIELETDVMNADVVIQSVEGQTLSVEIYTKKPNRFRIEQSISTVTVEEKKKNQLFCFFGCEESKSKIVIKVPQNVMDYELETLNGDIKISGIGQILEVKTVNGTVELWDSQFVEAILETVNGKIKVLDSIINNESTLSVVNGSLLVSNLESSYIEAETINGDFSITDLKGEVLNLSTVNGDFNLKNIYMSYSDVDKLNGEVSLKNEDLSYQIKSLQLSGLKKNHEIEANVLKISYN
ncbi:MAG: DUF4097 family beta strand repeat-containing protein [Turicibacter sanguinis]|uniref:DUF4097 family beta strand repeat-containing protein n=1 Tax=Turicibacter sanguinis TaxID=154288 RepID=UPI003995801D